MNKPVILVVDAHAVGAIGVIRSLGRAGYPVLAASASGDALGFRSRYCDRALVCPPYADREGFLLWLDATISEQQISLIIYSESFLETIIDHVDRYARYLPLSSDLSTLRRGLSKAELFESYLRPDSPPALKNNLPPLAIVDRQQPAPDLSALGKRLYIKTDALLGDDHGHGSSVQAINADGPGLETVRSVSSHYRKLVLQGHIPGVGTGVFLIRWQGRILCRFMYRCIHEVPHTGGTSSLRETWWHEGQYEDALARLEHLDWQGVVMFEYRWHEATDEFHLIEVNARFWQSLHLALFAGVDFPRILVDAVTGVPESPARSQQTATSWLLVPNETGYLLSLLKDPEVPAGHKLRESGKFLVNLLRPSLHSDLNFPGDRRIFWIALGRYVKEQLASLFRTKPS